MITSVLTLISYFVIPPSTSCGSCIRVDAVDRLDYLVLIIYNFRHVNIFHVVNSELLRRIGATHKLIVALVTVACFSTVLVAGSITLIAFIPFTVTILVVTGVRSGTILINTLVAVNTGINDVLAPVNGTRGLCLGTLANVPTSRVVNVVTPCSTATTIVLIVVDYIIFNGRPISRFRSLSNANVRRNILTPRDNGRRPSRVHVANCNTNCNN